MEYMSHSIFWKMVIFSSLVAAIAGMLGGIIGPWAGVMLLAMYIGSITALFVDAKEHEEWLEDRMRELNHEFDELWDELIELKNK
jgi:hypothetical protein